MNVDYFAHIEFYLKRAGNALLDGKIDSSIELYNEAITLCNNDIYAKETFIDAILTQRAIAYHLKQKWILAIDDCDKVIERKPNTPIVWTIRGRSKLALDREDEAIKDLRVALELNPEDKNAAFGLGYCYWQKDQRAAEYEERTDVRIRLLKKAAKYFRRAKELDNSSAENWRMLGFVCMQLMYLDTVESSWTDRALVAFKKSLSLDGNDADVWYNRGVILWRISYYRRALKSLLRAQELYPDYPEIDSKLLMLRLEMSTRFDEDDRVYDY